MKTIAEKVEQEIESLDASEHDHFEDTVRNYCKNHAEFLSVNDSPNLINATYEFSDGSMLDYCKLIGLTICYKNMIDKIEKSVI